MHVLACAMLLVVTSGCMSNLRGHAERHPEAQAAGEGLSMEPLIRPARGIGLVVGLRVPLELSRGAGAEAATLHDTTSQKLVALVTGKSLAPAHKARAFTR